MFPSMESRENLLFGKLKNWCSEVAEKKGVPIYYILHHDTMEEIAKKKPTNLEELDAISGMGHKKMESFGEKILEIINESAGVNPRPIKETSNLRNGTSSSKDDILTVDELTKYIKSLLESDSKLNNFFVRGEISNLTIAHSGHIYFSLKDEKSQIKCAFFNGVTRKLDFELEDGMKVIVRGGIDVYQLRGQYSLVVNEIHPDGLGALHLAFTQLKNKLDKEGLFSKVSKKQMPKFPKTVAIITSPSGDALHDILKILRERYPIIKVLLVPTLVQGKTSAKSIVTSIELINSYPKIDVAILGRGGGSLEDLWSFNDENVARAIFKSKVPLVSAVGHETDFTIADFVADFRAPTPTAAAEMIVPNLKEIFAQIEALNLRSTKSIYHKLKLYKSNLKQITSKVIFKRPLEIVHRNYRELDLISSELKNYTVSNLENQKKELKSLESALVLLSPINLLKSHRFELDQERYKIQNCIERLIYSKKKKIEIIRSKIEALNPTAILERGYSIVMKNNKILINSSNVEKGEDVDIILHQGKINAKVKKTYK